MDDSFEQLLQTVNEDLENTINDENKDKIVTENEFLSYGNPDPECILSQRISTHEYASEISRNNSIEENIEVKNSNPNEKHANKIDGHNEKADKNGYSNDVNFSDVNEIIVSHTNNQKPCLEIISPKSNEENLKTSSLNLEKEEEMIQSEINLEMTNNNAGYQDYLLSKEQLIGKYRQALNLYQQQREWNINLQHRLVDHMRKKKGDGYDTKNLQKDEDYSEIEKQYFHKLNEYKLMKKITEKNKELYDKEFLQLDADCKEIRQKALEEKQKLFDLKKNTANQIIQNKSELMKEVARKLAIENDKEKEIEMLRLENFKLLSKVRKKNRLVKETEKLSGGLRILDFEQLKIENQTYNEKIEDRNEDLLKLNEKKVNSIVALTHCNEKMNFVEKDLNDKNIKLQTVEKIIARNRDELSRMKIVRDTLRKENSILRNNMGLLKNKSLIRDYEKCVDSGDMLKSDVATLKNQYFDLLTRMKTIC